MSSEIRAGDNRTYWIISNGNSYVDGVTDPDLVTTVGNGWHISWIGGEYNEYLTACNNVGIIPRNSDPNIPTTNFDYPKISARQVRLWLIQNGISLDSITDAINNIEDIAVRNSVAIEWEYAPYIERSHPMLIPLAFALGMNESQVDQAFIEAANL